MHFKRRLKTRISSRCIFTEESFSRGARAPQRCNSHSCSTAKKTQTRQHLNFKVWRKLLFASGEDKFRVVQAFCCRIPEECKPQVKWLGGTVICLNAFGLGYWRTKDHIWNGTEFGKRFGIFVLFFSEEGSHLIRRFLFAASQGAAKPTPCSPKACAFA